MKVYNLLELPLCLWQYVLESCELSSPIHNFHNILSRYIFQAILLPYSIFEMKNCCNPFIFIYVFCLSVLFLFLFILQNQPISQQNPQKINLYQNLILKYFLLISMFKQQFQHSRNLQTSIFSNRNQPSLIRPQQGYHNIDSPLKAALRLQTSPHKNLSPLRYQTQTDSKLSNRRSRSPILFSRKDDSNHNNARISPLRKKQFYQAQQNIGPQKHISFTNLIRRNSNTGQYDSQKPSQFNRTMQHSNYLQSDRNFREDTNLFKKLANMIKSNKSNESSFMNSGISDNSVKYKAMPQSCRNQHSSNKKMFIKNVMTVQSIQSPEQKDYGNCNDNFADVETKCYQDYEKMTAECVNVNRERKSSFDCYQQKGEPRMQKKDSRKGSNQLQQFETISFKKISSGNERVHNQVQQISINTKIDYHITNSFGTTTRNLKNQIIGCQPQAKPSINPFEQILNDNPSQIQSSINRSSVGMSQDSMFASLQMLLEKVNSNHEEQSVHKLNQSINVSLMSQNEFSEIDMEPFLEKRR